MSITYNQKTILIKISFCYIPTFIIYRAIRKEAFFMYPWVPFINKRTRLRHRNYAYVYNIWMFSLCKSVFTCVNLVSWLGYERSWLGGTLIPSGHPSTWTTSCEVHSSSYSSSVVASSSSCGASTEEPLAARKSLRCRQELSSTEK